MAILVDTTRSLIQFSYSRFIIFQVKRFIRPLFAALILMFAGNAYAVITVGLAIENDLDSNGNITVINGSKVKVTYVVSEDTDKDLNKKDRIELRRVDGDELVSSVLRGKKKSGSVSLKVKNSEDEQLYVRYRRKTGTEIKRISHPDDAGIPLLSIAKASLSDLTVGLNALEGKSPAIGRIVVPVVSVQGGASISGASGILPDALSTTAFGGSFGVPTDYVSGNVTVKAIIAGCGGTSIAHENSQPSLDQVNIGANTTGFSLLSCTGFGTCPTVSIPPDTGAFPFITTFSIEVVSTYSSISDINTPAFRRLGAYLGDVCTGSLTVEGFIIEYPRG